MAKTKYQKFQTKRLHRTQIIGAEYNPRVIKPDARRKLKDKLKEVGLIIPLVWNQRTGNLVGGHQRIGIMDDIEGTNDYYLDISCIDVSLEKEKEFNVFLNNQTAQGTWDFEKLTEMFKDIGIEGFESAGFDFPDLANMFGSVTPEVFKNVQTPSSMMSGGPTTPPLSPSPVALDNLPFMGSPNLVSPPSQGSTDLTSEPQLHPTIEKGNASDFYAIMTFDTQYDADIFIEQAELFVENRYVKCADLCKAMKIDLA